ncbi:ligase-associated DNA damage response endonuclease PdeM [Acidisphaera sp. S103]|uniref:ligase-associated DNA damage response endonuclease PdeM n=1 Tax=Acidisphaera sp. S103 TaxID=1747223 RepID=UPI00131B0A33|nr:ligase-associated DNA damage response endonuclease PdeM [Acidisphaera sp. S103]
MTAAPIHLAGERLMLDPMGALFWPERHLLAVSDLHLEKGSSFARRGMLLPPWDTHASIDRLTLLLRRWSPATVVALGDSFHDADGSGRLPVTEQQRLNAMTQAHRFIWVQGNHDPSPPDGLGGEWVESHVEAAMVFRHEAVSTAGPGEIVGHHHPKATIPARTGNVSRPCFVFDGRRLMMPAFGAYTGGLDVRDPAINRLFPRGGRVFLLGKDRLFSFEIGRGAALRVG